MVHGLHTVLLIAALLQGGARSPGVPSTIHTLYVVEMEHLDVGFTAPPSVVADGEYTHLLDALHIADTHPNFRWTIESAWQLEQFDQRASAADRQRLRARFAEGRFALSGSYLNLHSSLWGEELLNRYGLPGADLARRYHATVRSAFLDDVPGGSRGLPRVLAGTGVSYMLLGANDFLGGKPDIPLAQRPFWWQSPDGSRVLTWLPYGSYAEGFTDWGLLTMQTAFDKISQRLPEYEAAGYPYDAVLVMRGFDNAGPSAGMDALAAQWNATYDNPKILLATPHEFFDHLLATYGDVFPTWEGNASGLWAVGTENTPESQALVRHAQAALPADEALLTRLYHEKGAPYPAREIDDAWRCAMVFLEHSGGGAGWPGMLTAAQVDQQNREFVHIARGAADGETALRERALAALGPRRVPVGERGVVLFNPLGEDFEGVVEVSCPGPQAADLRLEDPSGGPDAIFRWTRPDRSALAFRAQVPAHGWRRWRVTSGGHAPPPPTWGFGDRIAIGGRELILDPADGTALSLHESNGREWLPTAAPTPLGGVLRGSNRQVFFGINHADDPAPVRIEIEDPGPVFRMARVYGPAGGLLREYRLYEDAPRLDVVAFVNEDKLGDVPVDKNSMHYGMSFPAALALPTRLFVDGPDGWYEPGPDSLPGAALNAFPTPTGELLRGAQGNWLCATPLESAVLDLGEMNGAASAQVEDDEASFTVRLINHATESQLQGGGVYRFVAEPGLPSAFRSTTRLRFGTLGDQEPGRETLRADLAPPPARWVERGTAPPALAATGTFLDLSGPATLVAWKRAYRDDGDVLRLRARATGTATLLLPRAPSAAWLCDLREIPLQPLPLHGRSLQLSLQEHAVLTILLED